MGKDIDNARTWGRKTGVGVGQKKENKTSVRSLRSCHTHVFSLSSTTTLNKTRHPQSNSITQLCFSLFIVRFDLTQSYFSVIQVQ